MKSRMPVEFITLVVLVFAVGLSNVGKTTASPADFETEPLEGEGPRLFFCTGIQWWWCPITTTTATTTSKPKSTTTMTTSTTTKLTTTLNTTTPRLW